MDSKLVSSRSVPKIAADLAVIARYRVRGEFPHWWTCNSWPYDGHSVNPTDPKLHLRFALGDVIAHAKEYGAISDEQYAMLEQILNSLPHQPLLVREAAARVFVNLGRFLRLTRTPKHAAEEGVDAVMAR